MFLYYFGLNLPYYYRLDSDPHGSGTFAGTGSGTQKFKAGSGSGTGINSFGSATLAPATMGVSRAEDPDPWGKFFHIKTEKMQGNWE